MSRGKKIKQKPFSQAAFSSRIDLIVNASPATSSARHALEKAGGEVYLVGGAIRDLLKHTQPKDLDLLVKDLPLENAEGVLKQLPGRVDLTGKKFGVLRFKFNKDEVEIALPRTEHSTGPKRKEFTTLSDHNLSIEDDLQRRDFTINAIAWDFKNKALIDPFNGQADLKNRILQTVTPDSFSQDATRIVRGLVAVSRHHLVATNQCKQEMEKYRNNISLEAVEGVREELEKLFKADRTTSGLNLAEKTQVREVIFHQLDKAGHEKGVSAIDKLPKDAEPDLKLMSYLSTLSTKELTAQLGFEDGGLKYPNKRLNTIVKTLEAVHSPLPANEVQAKEWLAVHDNFLTQIKPIWAATDIQTAKDIKRATNLIAKVQDEPYKTSQLQVRGDLIAKQLELKPGPVIGEALTYLIDKVRHDKDLNNEVSLLKLATLWHQNQT